MSIERPAAKRTADVVVAGFILLGLIALLSWWEQEAKSAAVTSLEVHFSLPPGEYAEDIFLEIFTPNPEVQIYFTLDGRLPDPAADQLYSDPIHLAADPPQAIVVRALAALPDSTDTGRASATYFMGLDTSLPKLSLIVDPDDLYDQETGIYVNHLERGRDWERPVDVTYVTEDGETAFQLGAGLRIHGELTRWFFDKKSLRLYFRGEYGPTKLEYPIFGHEGQVAFDKLILHNSMKDLLLFRNQLAERLFAQAGGFTSRSQPVLLFINGEPWGIYHIREAIDQRFLEENFGVPSADLSDTPNIRSRQSAEQRRVDLVHWENFMAFVEENDLSDPANYDYLKTQIDLENFIDYYLLEMYAGNTDWPHHNVTQFRPRTQGGRWEWILWDDDRSFEQVERQMVDHVLVATHPLGQKMETLLNKLLANPEFRTLFLTRAADLLNTSLSTAVVQAQVDEITGQLAGDINIERDRWDISGEWVDTVQHMTAYAAQRPDIMRRHFIESFALEGMAQISFNQGSEPPGWIVVNETDPQQLPWSGAYFLGSEITLRAVPPAGYRFAGWQGAPAENEGGRTLQGPSIILPVTGDMAITPLFEPLPADVPHPGDVTIESYHADDEGEIQGDWFELRINRDNLDLGGWRITDNDTIEAADEGSIFFLPDPLLENLAAGDLIRVIATESNQNAARFPEDGRQDGVLVLYAGNGRLDTQTDPWFNLGPRDNLVLLAPGPSAEWADDLPVDLWSANEGVKGSSFGLPPGSR